MFCSLFLSMVSLNKILFYLYNNHLQHKQHLYIYCLFDSIKFAVFLKLHNFEKIKILLQFLK